MKIEELGCLVPSSLDSGESVSAAAQAMAELDVDALPIVEGGDLRGILTDRDILIRVVAEGLDASATTVAQIMSTDVVSCAPQADFDEVRGSMTERRIRHMPVVGADGRLVGMFTLTAAGEPVAREVRDARNGTPTGAAA